MFTEQIEEILEEIVQSLATITDAERAYWKLSPEEREQLPQLMCARFDALAE
jgi:hypothetical protein